MAGYGDKSSPFVGIQSMNSGFNLDYFGLCCLAIVNFLKIFEIFLKVVYSRFVTFCTLFRTRYMSVLNLSPRYRTADILLDESLTVTQEVRADLVKIEESGAVKDTATLTLISRLCDELRERRASAE